MSVFTRHSCPELSPADLIVLVMEQPGAASRIVTTPSTGAHLGGRITRWYAWSVAPGQAPVPVTSILDEDDPDDAPFDSHGGVLAIPAGTRTAYVSARRPEERDDLAGRSLIRDGSRSEFFAPRPDEQGDIDPVLRELAGLLRRTLPANNEVDVAVGLQFVCVEWTGGAAQVEQTAAGFQVEAQLEAYTRGVDPGDSALGIEVRERVRSILLDEVAPEVEALGFTGTMGTVWVEHGDASVVSEAGNWRREVPSAEAAVELIRALLDLELCREVEAGEL